MTKSQIKQAFAKANTNISKVAENMPYSRTNLSIKINRETLTDDELKQIANIIGCKYVCQFVFDDGTII